MKENCQDIVGSLKMAEAPSLPKRGRFDFCEGILFSAPPIRPTVEARGFLSLIESVTMQLLMLLIFVALIASFIFYYGRIIVLTITWSTGVATILHKKPAGGSPPVYRYLLRYQIGENIYEEYAKYMVVAGSPMIGNPANILYNPNNPREIAMVNHNSILYWAIVYLDDFIRIKLLKSFSRPRR